MLDAITGSLIGNHPREVLERVGFALLDYVEQNSDGFRILVRDSPVATSTGTFASLISDVASQVEHLLVDQFRQRGFEPATPRCTRRCSSAASRSRVSGGSTFANRARTRSSPTW